MLISLVISTIAFFAIGIYARRYLESNNYAEGRGARLLAFVIAAIGSILVGSGVDKVEDLFKSPDEIQQEQQDEQQLKDAMKQLQDSSKQSQDTSSP